MASAPASVSGARKAAIALMVLGDEGSSAVFRHLQEDEIEKIAREIATMGAVSAEVGEQVLTEIATSAGQARGATGGVEQARRILSKALSPDQTRRVLDRVVHSLNSNAGFASLERANPEQLSKFFLGEHPQTTALILAHLKPATAAQLLAQFPEEMRAEVLLRMAALGEIPPDVLARVSSVIDQKLKNLGGTSPEQRGGVRAVAELFNVLDRTVSRTSLDKLEELSPETAAAIRNLMFVFDDLLSVEEAGIREIVNRVDKKVLTIALKGASEPIRQRFFSNMSKRAVDLLKEEMEIMGAVKLREVERSQHEVVGIARKLEEEGLISTGGAGDDEYVT